MVLAIRDEEKRQMISAYEKMVKTLSRTTKVFCETESNEIRLENGETLEKSELFIFEEIFNKLILFCGANEMLEEIERKKYRPRPICDLCNKFRWWKNINIEYDDDEGKIFICKKCEENSD